MKSSRKKPYRLFALVAVFAALCVALPQLSRMSEFRNNKSTAFKSKQDPQSAKGLAPQGKDDAGPSASPDDPYSVTIPSSQVPKQRVNAPQVVSAATKQGEVEPNGTSATASPITGRSAKIVGNLWTNGDIDFYSFTANAGDRFYGAVMTSFSAGNSTDSQLTLIASDGTTTIEFDDDNGSFAALSSSIAGATIPTAGTYFLKVNDFTAGTTSERPYELWFQLQGGTPTPEVESNDTPATANPLPASGWVSGARNPAAATEQDWYSLSLNAGDTVYLSLDLDPERDGVTWNGRLGFGLFGDATNQILVVDDAGTGDVTPVPNRPSEAFFMTVKTAGTYFAFVDSATAATGGPTATYNLNVTVLPRPVVGVNCTTYTSTDVPKTIGPGTGLVSSTITIPGNPRIEDIRVSITLNHALMQDVDVHLRSPAGNDNGIFTDIGAAATGGQAQMDLTFDDEAGIPPGFTVLKGLQFKPENNSTAGTASTSGAYRLGWYKGENAGGTWTLDIRDDTAGANGGTLTAWSITICEPAPAPACAAGATQTVFSTDFESGAAGFTHSGTQDEWELGTPATVATTTANPVAAFNTANSGSNCWKTDLDNTYNASSNQELLSPNINLVGLVGPIRLTWAQRDQIETANFDHAFVDVREVGNPTNFKRVWEWLDPTPISASAGTGNPQANIGGSEGWGLRYADISSFAGKNIEVVFHLDSDSSVQFGGMAIDDVSVTACLAVVPCVLTCPANVTQTNDPNQCGAVVTYPAPTSTGNCGTVTCSPASGSFFPVGTTTVTCTPTTGTACSFTVTVTDDQPPSITCPANITRSNDANQCGAVVTYPAPTITDNCPGTFTATCTPPSGSFFPVGTTTVTCSVNGAGSRGATPDGACTIQTITESSSQAIEALNSVSCNDGFGHTDNSYWRAFTLSSFGISTAFNVQSIDIAIEDAISGSGAAAGSTKGSTPPASGGGKGSAVPIKKKSISRKTSGSRPAGGGQPMTVRIYTSSTAFPAGFPGSLTLIGTANVTVADQSGTILNVPITGTAPAGSQLVVEVFTPDGTATGNLIFIGSNSAAETGPSYLSAPDCGISTPTTTTAIGFPDMHIVMNVNGCPQSSGGGSTCTFTVTVQDTQAPTITCPANVTAVTPVCAGTTAVVTYPAPTASDNCPGVTTACVPPSGSTFPIGVTTVTCTATDASGNTATCSFTVTVFNACIQDDNNPGTVLLWNTVTGAYRFCCNGTTYTGTGLVQNKGNSHTINHAPVDRRVNGVLDCATSKGQGGLQSNAGALICAINDRDIRNNTCSCGGAPPAPTSTK